MKLFKTFTILTVILSNNALESPFSIFTSDTNYDGNSPPCYRDNEAYIEDYTQSDISCIDWDDRKNTEYGKYVYENQGFGDRRSDHNFCRKDASSGQPWCVTIGSFDFHEK